LEDADLAVNSPIGHQAAQGQGYEATCRLLLELAEKNHRRKING